MTATDPRHDAADERLRRAAAAYARVQPTRVRSPFDNPEFRRQLRSLAATRSERREASRWRRLLGMLADVPRVAVASGALSIALLSAGALGSMEAGRTFVSERPTAAAAPMADQSGTPKEGGLDSAATPSAADDTGGVGSGIEGGEREVSLLLVAGAAGLAATLGYLVARRRR